MQWFDKLFFTGLVLMGAGGLTAIFAFWSMLRATRPHL
jgi:hypothetical protein